MTASASLWSTRWRARAIRPRALRRRDCSGRLPEQDGISVLKQIHRDYGALPVIVLTARNTEYDRVLGLDSGADDYISKPFGMMELVARVRAVLRRTGSGESLTVLTAGELSLFPERHEVQVGGSRVALTYKEYRLLSLLLENRGNVMTREILMEKVWGLEAERENRTLDVHIRTLRAKLGPAGKYIETIRGVGYRVSGEVS